MTQKHYRAAMTMIVMMLTTLTAWAITGTGTKQAPYTIENATDWNVFCDLLEENAKGYFTGKTVTLANNISVTRMAGTSSKPFTGIFNGGGKTLNVNYENTSGETRTAPFSYVDGATIQNLIVDGSITGSDYRAAGVIGETGTTTSHIINCVSSLNISSGRYTGGFSIGGNVEIEGCLFNGKINGTSMSGGFVGYSNSKLKIKNSLFAPQSGSSISGGTFYYDAGGSNTPANSPVNSYYTQALGDSQGKAARTVTAGDQYVTTCTVCPKGDSTATYSLSGITAYNNGIVRDSTFYYGRGDQVSLNLAHSTREGYTFNSYTPSDGTLNGTTLTMPEADVTIGSNWTAITYTITYNLDGGSVAADNPTTYNVETPTFTLTNPTKPGYTFTGWTEGNDNTLLPTVTIELGSTTDRTYTANYEFAQITEGDLSFVCTSGTEVKVTACNNSGATSVIIPATVTNSDGTYTVTAIEASAFSGCTSLLAVILDSATPPTLGSGAFSACTALNAIGVPAGTAEAYKAAAGWTAYAEKIHVIDGICSTGVYYSYDGITKTLYIFGTGSMWKSYMERPWNSYREDIKTVIIGHGVTSIGQDAFYGCTSLPSITIPTSVTSIGGGAFGYCTSLASITIPYGVTTIEKWVFLECSGLTSITIPASVTEICDNAFFRCTSLPSITIPASVTTIGNGAFQDCTSLESIEIPAGVTSITGNPMYGCYGLKSISVAPENPNYNSRNNCNALIETKTNKLIQGCNNAFIPDGVTIISSSAFYQCTGLTSITIPASVTEIYGNAFYGCTGLTSIEIPASVTEISSSAFNNCSGLESISVAAGNTVYDSRNNCNAIIETETNTLIKGFKNTVIPGGSDGVTTIGGGAFNECTGLTSIEIPASVTTIDDYAFEGCTGLFDVILESETPPTLGSRAFDGCTALDAIYVPARAVETYKTADDWLYYADKIRVVDGTCGTEVYYSYDGTTKTLRISGTGAIADYNGTNMSWKDYLTDITTVVVGPDVTGIGNAAFSGCTSLNMLTLYSATPTTLSSSALGGCAALNTIYVPSGSVEAYKAAASWAAYKDKIQGFDGTCGDNVYYSYDDATKTLDVFGTGTMANYQDNDRPWYSYLEDITTVVIGRDVTGIGTGAFYNCTSLNSVTIYAPSLSYYGRGAFHDNASGRKIYVFSDCVNTYKAQASLMYVNANDILPIEGISLKDAADNRSLIAAANGHTLNVTLQDRTLRKDGKWNTLCLPFTLALNGSPLEGATVMELDVKNANNGHYTGFDATTGTLYLNFQSATTIEAGKPYIVKWGNAGDLESPVFNGVTISSIAPTSVTSADGKLTFTGTYAPVNIGAEGDNATLTFADNGKLYHPNIETTIGSQRAYFRLDGISISGKGDVNGDGMINDSDIECMANHLLGKANPAFIATNADMNQTKAVDISDLTSLVNLLLDTTAVKQVVINAE